MTISSESKLTRCPSDLIRRYIEGYPLPIKDDAGTSLLLFDKDVYTFEIPVKEESKIPAFDDEFVKNLKKSALKDLGTEKEDYLIERKENTITVYKLAQKEPKIREYKKPTKIIETISQRLEALYEHISTSSQGPETQQKKLVITKVDSILWVRYLLSEEEKRQLTENKDASLKAVDGTIKYIRNKI